MNAPNEDNERDPQEQRAIDEANKALKRIRREKLYRRFNLSALALVGRVGSMAKAVASTVRESLKVAKQAVLYDGEDK